jgi:hypothetical protein
MQKRQCNAYKNADCQLAAGDIRFGLWHHLTTATISGLIAITRMMLKIDKKGLY